MSEGQSVISYGRQLDVRCETDVLDPGGGPAGVDVHGVDVRDLQNRLKSLGAYLPNLK